MAQQQRPHGAAIYVRGQGQEDPALVEQQKRCEDYARQHNLDLAGIFRDFGSGPTEDTVLLRDRIADGEIDAILVSAATGSDAAGELSGLTAAAQDKGVKMITVP